MLSNVTALQSLGIGKKIPQNEVFRAGHTIFNYKESHLQFQSQIKSYETFRENEGF